MSANNFSQDPFGIIRFRVESDGTSGTQWISRLQNQCFDVKPEAKEFLLSSDFVATSGQSFNIAIFTFGRGAFCSQEKWNSFDVLEYALKNRDMLVATPEVACLVRAECTKAVLSRMRIQVLSIPVKIHLMGQEEIENRWTKEDSFSASRVYNANSFTYRTKELVDSHNDFFPWIGVAFLEPSSG